MGVEVKQEEKGNPSWDRVVVVEPQPKVGVLSWLLDVVEALAIRIANGKNGQQAQFFLTGNHAPVRETPPAHNLLVRGFLPDCLNGEFVRVGPNPKFAPLSSYHWFDGDGMIHGLRIKDGKATYVSRFVRTSRLKQEEVFGRAKFMKTNLLPQSIPESREPLASSHMLGDLHGLFGLFTAQMFMLRAKLKALDVSYGIGTGKCNTNLVYHHGRLLALQEGDKPYALKVLEDGDLQTLGLMDYDKRLAHAFTAHPKIDPFTGEMFTFGYSRTPPYLTYRVITKEGVMLDPVPITLSAPVLMHDFAITENFAIFMDLPLYFTPQNMAKGGLAYKFDETKRARFGILPRYAKDELQMRWFELPNCFIFHNANAWEEGDEVILITCRMENPDLDVIRGSNPVTLEDFKNELYEMRFDLKTGEASQKKLSGPAVDFPRINENYTGRISEINVIDAKTMSTEPVAVVELPTRVPYGFHAFFVTEEQIQQQPR
ncbi:Carotenoid 9-10(9'-10)-cleavage dioxygenase [Nymphaea thermarum]|nr:Carotenoid 9-10(9'-10)-cleavage dioxygenase [Nymphaea thermarum]